jgi:hypothetical protein
MFLAGLCPVSAGPWGADGLRVSAGALRAEDPAPADELPFIDEWFNDTDANLALPVNTAPECVIQRDRLLSNYPENGNCSSTKMGCRKR